MIKWLGNIIDRLFAVAGALVFSQAPLFMQYYTQQLSGHVAELKLNVEAMGKIAAQSGKTLDQYVLKFMASTDPDFNLQGKLMQSMVERWTVFNENLYSMQNATVWTRPFLFIRQFDWDIARTTYHTFEVGLTFNLEGIIYAFLGLLFGYLVFMLIRKVFTFIFSPFVGLFSRKPKNLPPSEVEKNNLS